jgi:hypothetical protein
MAAGEKDRELVNSMAVELRAWMKRVRRDACGELSSAEELRGLGVRMLEARAAIGRRDRSSNGAEWGESLASYRKTLEELGSFLREFDINLRIRRSEINAAHRRVQAVNAWSDAVKRFG